MEHTEHTQMEWEEIKKEIKDELKYYSFDDEYLISVIGESLGENWIQENFHKNKKGAQEVISLRKKLEINRTIRFIIHTKTMTRALLIFNDIIVSLDENSSIEINISRLKETEKEYDKKMAEITYGSSYLFYPHSYKELMTENIDRTEDYSIFNEKWADFYYFMLCAYVRINITRYYTKEDVILDFIKTFNKNQEESTKKIQKLTQKIEKAKKTKLSDLELFENFFPEQNSKKIIERLKPIIQGKKGKALYTIILALQKKGVMRGINDNELRKFHNCLSSLFGNLGSYQALQDAISKYKGQTNKALFISNVDIENLISSINKQIKH